MLTKVLRIPLEHEFRDADERWGPGEEGSLESCMPDQKGRALLSGSGSGSGRT